MTQEEFDKTAFRKGDRVRIKNKIFLIETVNFKDKDFYIAEFGKCIPISEILEYIPVEVEGKEKLSEEEITILRNKSNEFMILILKSNGYRVQKKTETWEDC